MYLANIRRVFIEGDTYQYNSGLYKEALDTYGTIITSGEYDTNYDRAPGAWKFSGYYSDADDNATIESSYFGDNTAREQWYSYGILRIGGSLYASITNTTFDNNYFVEFETDSVINDYRSLAILFERCNGEAYINSLTLQNYYGWNLDNLQTILGSSKYSNVVTTLPTERNQYDGSPNNEATAPSYDVDYGFKNALIRLSHPSTDSQSDFKNVFSKMKITSLNVNNVTHYNPREGIAAIIEVSDDVLNFELIDAHVDNIDIIQDSKSMFYLQPYGTLTVTGGTFSNINSNAYSLDTDEMSYVSTVGSVFTINSVLKSEDSVTFKYALSSMTFDTIYGKIGWAVYMSKETSAIIQHEVSVTISNTTFQNSRSLTNGLIYSSENRHNITISNCTFRDNHGVDGEADLYYASSNSFIVSDTLFTKFRSDSISNFGQSITLQMAVPFANTVEFQDVTVRCNDKALTSDEYLSRIEEPDTYLTKKAPVLLNPGSLKTINSAFSNWHSSEKGGVMYWSTSSVYNDEGSNFTQNSAKEGGAVFITDTTINLTDTVLTINYAETGGAVKLDGSSTTADYYNVTCSNNTATQDGGWLSFIASSNVQLRSSIFRGNHAHDTSSAIYALGTGTNTITDSIFSENVALVGNTIWFLFADTTLENITMQDNECSADSCNIFVSFSTVSIVNSRMKTTRYPGSYTTITEVLENYNETSGYFLSISAGSNIAIINTNFTRGFASNGGLIYMLGNSAMSITRSIFKQGYASIKGGAIYASSFKTLTINNSSFVDNMAYDWGSTLFLNYGTIIFNSSNVNATPNFDAVNIIGSTYTSTNVEYSLGSEVDIVNENLILGGAIFVMNPKSFSITNNIFIGLDYAYQGGAIYMSMSSSERSNGIPSSPICIITSWNFTSNKAKFGGAIYNNEVTHVQISNTSFTNNTAEKDETGGNGGALYYSSSDNSSQIVFKSGITFNINNAEDSGGAVFWNYNQPVNLTAASYSGNTASLYGNDYGCFSQLIKTITSSQYNLQIGSRRNLDNTTSSGSTNVTIDNQQSGAKLEPIYTALYDEFGQIVGSDSKSTITIRLTTINNNDTYPPQLIGSLTLTFDKGVAQFGTINFTAEPTQSYNLEFSPTGIDPLKPSNKNYLLSNSLPNTSMPLAIGLRGWIVGELFETSGACTEWQSPNYYSLEIMTEPGRCKDWQKTHMYWYGGSDIGPKPNFWRSSNMTDKIIKWLYPPACLGYNKSDITTNLGEWLTGYQGILWADWKVGYSRRGKYECSKCPDPVWNIIRLILVLIAIVIFIIVLLYITLKSIKKRSNRHPIYVKILINHLQMQMMIVSLSIDLPEEIIKMIETIYPVDHAINQLMSFDCFIDQRSEDDGNGNRVRLYFQKMIILALLPIFLLLISVLIWNLWACFKKRCWKKNDCSKEGVCCIKNDYCKNLSIGKDDSERGNVWYNENDWCKDDSFCKENCCNENCCEKECCKKNDKCKKNDWYKKNITQKKKIRITMTWSFLLLLVHPYITEYMISNFR